jgi:hypothetical protein
MGQDGGLGSRRDRVPERGGDRRSSSHTLYYETSVQKVRPWDGSGRPKTPSSMRRTAYQLRERRPELSRLSQQSSVTTPKASGNTIHTLVDGGVWSNFPIFIFEDAAFRKAYNRVPPRLSKTEILGFTLKDREELPPPKGRAIKFAPRGESFELRWRTGGARVPTRRSCCRPLG